MKLFRRLALAVTALLIAAAVAYAYMPRAVDVAVTVASRGPMEVSVEEEGRTRVRERYVITAPVAAYAPRLQLHVGDPVRAGQTVVVLQPLPPGVLDVRSRAQAEARVAQARAALHAARTNADAARAAADYASRDYLRLKSLRATGAVSQAALDQADTEARRSAAMLASAGSSIEVAKYDLASAEAALRYTVGERGGEKVPVASPVDGVVLAVEHEDEGVVASASPLVTVGDPHSLEVVVDVLSSDAVRIRPGTRVEFSRWGGPLPLQGRVRLVEPVAYTKVSSLGVEEQRVNVIVDLTSPDRQWLALGDGYRLEARFVIWEAEDALRVPSSALFRSGDGWAVLMVRDGRIAEQPVGIGERGDLYAAVLDGLHEGDAVITYPDDSLRAGARASIVREDHE